MPVVYVYSCALRSDVMHIGAGSIVILTGWVYQSLQVENDDCGLRFLYSLQVSILCFGMVLCL